MGSGSGGARSSSGRPKLFVLDTNVILHDGDCLYSFHEHDVAIPIVVLEELDRFKRGDAAIHQQARSFLRQLDALAADALVAEGVPLGEDLGSARVVLSQPSARESRDVFVDDCPDHRILDCALWLSKSEPDRRVVLVTKDTNLRLKANSLGLVAEDYTTDKVDSVSALYSGRRLVEGVPTELVDALHQGDRLDGNRLELETEPRPNENFILRNGTSSALAAWRARESVFEKVPNQCAFGIRPRNAEQTFALAALLDERVRLVTLTGRAGTGKTLLALAAALERRREYRQILLARPVVPLSNRDLGYLPGEIADKLDPYMKPLFDNLGVIRGANGHEGDSRDKIASMIANDKIAITPLAYIRGRSLQRVFLIVDEAQNLTPHEVKTILTRAGEGTKIALTGDIRQIDHPYLDSLSNGLSYLIDRMVGQPLHAHVTLEKGERSELATLASELL